MKPRLSPKRNAAMTLFEVVFILAVIALLAALLIPALKSAKHKANKISCVSCLKQIGLASKIWEGDHGNRLPMGISVTNGGSMELVATGDVVSSFLVMSNELATPFVIFCPSEPTINRTRNFAGLSRTNISYFISADAMDSSSPLMILSGDSSFGLGGIPAKSGLRAFSTNDSVAWSPITRHLGVGNILLGDGSVQYTTSSNLQSQLEQTGLATNRFAIP